MMVLSMKTHHQSWPLTHKNLLFKSYLYTLITMYVYVSMGSVHHVFFSTPPKSEGSPNITHTKCKYFPALHTQAHCPAIHLDVIEEKVIFSP